MLYRWSWNLLCIFLPPLAAFTVWAGDQTPPVPAQVKGNPSSEISRPPIIITQVQREQNPQTGQKIINLPPPPTDLIDIPPFKQIKTENSEKPKLSVPANLYPEVPAPKTQGKIAPSENKPSPSRGGLQVPDPTPLPAPPKAGPGELPAPKSTPIGKDFVSPSQIKPAPAVPPVSGNDPIPSEKNQNWRPLEQTPQTQVSDPQIDFSKFQKVSGQVANAMARWIIHVEIMDDTTHLIARGKETEIRVQCKQLKMQSPTGDIQAEGGIQIGVAGLQMSCDRLVISWKEDWVRLEGKVLVSTQKNGQRVELKGSELNLRLTTLTSAEAAKEVESTIRKVSFSSNKDEIPGLNLPPAVPPGQRQTEVVPNPPRLIPVQPPSPGGVFPKGQPNYYRRVTK